MRGDLPNLNHHPVETFRSLSWPELMKLDKKNESNGKSGKKLTEKMAKNLEKIKKNPIKVQPGRDNRSDILHNLRWKGGHICKNTEAWIEARGDMGISGLDPISRYDTEGVGMNGHINGAILAALHNPGSKKFIFGCYLRTP